MCVPAHAHAITCVSGNSVLKVVLINMIAVMISAKLATLGLLKIKVFWDKGYDMIISVHKILSQNSIYTVDVVMWPKFGNSSNSMREVTITSILKGFDQKKNYFLRVLLVQVQ